jgi:hypothetical protein
MLYLPCSPLKVNRRFGGICRFHLQCLTLKKKESRLLQAVLATYFSLIYCLAFSFTLKTEAICSSETYVNFQRTTRNYIPEDNALHNHRCENSR